MQDQDKSDVSLSSSPVSQSIEWFHEGQARTVVVEGVEVTVRLVGRKGRRARIAITAPSGAVFRKFFGGSNLAMPTSKQSR